LLAFGVGIVYITSTPSIMNNIVLEREKNLKNQMIVSGVKLPAYWLGHYAKDITFGMILALVVIILINIFDIELEYGWLMIILGALIQPPFIYALSFVFDKAETAQGLMTFALFVFSFLGPIAIFVLQIIEATRDIAVPLKWILSLIPQFAVTSSLFFISFKQLFGFLQPADGACGKECDISTPESFDNRIAGPQLTMLLISFVLWSLIVIFIDSSIWKNCIRVP